MLNMWGRSKVGMKKNKENLMRDIQMQMIDGDKVLSWTTDTDFEYGAYIGDAVSVWYSGPQETDKKAGVIADITPDSVIIRCRGSP